MTQPIYFSDAFIEAFPEIFSYVQDSLFHSIIVWMIDSKKRRAYFLSNWLEEQVSKPADSVKKFEQSIEDSDNYDYQMILVYQAAKDKLVYKGDITHWSASEYWATADETITGTSIVDGIEYGPWEGDCEDGAVLQYILARLKGIPTNRLMIWCGDVVNGGHACLFYKPINYPLNFVSMDWCYYPNDLIIEMRDHFNFLGNSIQEFKFFSGSGWEIKSSKYLSSWFFFSENWSAPKYQFKPVSQ